jgi:dTDP-4-amino-4,6-dideoxygalactose transaminase
VSLPKTELAARSEVTLPLYSHMTEDDQDRVVAALAEEL